MELLESITLFYTKMSFKILKFSNRPSISLLPEHSTLVFYDRIRKSFFFQAQAPLAMSNISQLSSTPIDPPALKVVCDNMLQVYLTCYYYHAMHCNILLTLGPVQEVENVGNRRSSN
jgi:hypothetical protein